MSIIRGWWFDVITSSNLFHDMTSDITITIAVFT